MPPPFDTIIVGAGLAGACAAAALNRQGPVLALDAEGPAAGASGAAAGLVNPLMGQQARLAWRADEALTALNALLQDANATALFQQAGLLRPALDASQAHRFRAVAQAQPRRAAWLSPDAARGRFPGIVVHEGALLVRQGGAIRVSDFVEALLETSRQRGTEIQAGRHVTGWGEDAEGAFVTLQHPRDRIYSRRVLLALGYGYYHHPELTSLNLHAVKGQVVRVARPDALRCENLLPLAGQGYVVPEQDSLVVGSSYERGFADLAPSPEQTRKILAKMGRMLPALQEATVLGATAGVRVTVPGTRLPMLGPLPGRRRIWIFTGLGSKGLLMAPLLARHLPTFFEKPESIPPQVWVR